MKTLEEIRQINAEKSARYREARMRYGVCLRCGVNPRKPGKKGKELNVCVECAGADAQRASAWRADLIAKGICSQCAKSPSEGDRTLCGPCHAKARERSNAHKARKKAAADAAGLCTSCNAAARGENRLYCESCLVKAQMRRYTKLGLTLAQMQAFGDKCHLCSRATSADKKHGRLHVDHDHKTGKVRGLLCKGCNTALGAFEDDSALMRRAADYVDLHHGVAKPVPPPIVAPEAAGQFYRGKQWTKTEPELPN